MASAWCNWSADQQFDTPELDALGLQRIRESINDNPKADMAFGGHWRQKRRSISYSSTVFKNQLEESDTQEKTVKNFTFNECGMGFTIIGLFSFQATSMVPVAISRVDHHHNMDKPRDPGQVTRSIIWWIDLAWLRMRMPFREAAKNKIIKNANLIDASLSVREHCLSVYSQVF